jgi:sulfate permease, SulP family
MQLKHYKFDRVELAGSLGDLGTLIPLSVALILLTGLNASAVLLTIGIFYIVTGIYFKLPIPVQPLKVVAAIAIAYPERISVSVIIAAGFLMGIFLLFLSLTGLIDWISKFFKKPIIRGIQFGLGLILISKSIELISKPNLFINDIYTSFSSPSISINLVIGIIAFFIVLVLLRSKKYPAALVIVFLGLVVGVSLNSFELSKFELGIVPFEFIFPNSSEFLSALILLVIPQIPLTIGNAIIGTKDACETFFGKNELIQKVTHRTLTFSMGIANIFIGLLGGLPLCHGAGGLAAHYRFGARTGGSNIMIGAIFVIIAIVFGKIAITILSIIPNAILGVLLLFAGLELALLILDVREKKNLFIVLIVAGLGFITKNMAIAFLAGIIIAKFIVWRKIKV